MLHGLGLEHGANPTANGWNVPLAQFLDQGFGIVVTANKDADVVEFHWARFGVRAELGRDLAVLEKSLDVVSHINGNGSANGIGVFFSGIWKKPKLQRISAAGEPCVGVIVGRGDGNIGNVLIAEGDSCEPCIECLDQRSVGAIVRRHLSL